MSRDETDLAVQASLSRDKIGSELSKAVAGMFTVDFHQRVKKFDATYTVMHCKPTRTVAESLLLTREVLALVANFDDVQVRCIQLAKQRIESSGGRLDPALVIVVHADKQGDEKLRTWGREQGLKVIPIYRHKAGALPTAEILRRNLAQELFALDPFQVTGPVVNDMDFFGRRNDAIEILRQLQAGRIRALFGLRKVGKTSLLNRVVGLARESGAPRVAMIDCSVTEFARLRAPEALRAVAKVVRLAAHQGYAHISEALRKSDVELVPTFDDLWSQHKGRAIAVVFDEVDYITPASPNHPHWREDFNEFWRELRVVHQEAQRQGSPLAMLISGVSSDAFRVESFGGVENAVLHFVPEDYLAPFAREASRAMLKDLEHRCGMVLTESDRDALAGACGDFPYWMRMAGSYLHKRIDVTGRPLTLRSDVFQALLDEFVVAEGADIARVALEDLGRKFPDIVVRLREAAGKPSVSLAEGGMLSKYGLAVQKSGKVVVESLMVRSALDRVPEQVAKVGPTPGQPDEPQKLSFNTEEWAEELAVLNRRRNLLERALREFVRVVLKVSSKKGESWADKVLVCLPQARRAELSSLAGDALLGKLFWKELEQIVSRYWAEFELTFGDKKRFQLTMGMLNDRPDAHAKALDAADLALYRREMAWLEERIG